MHCNINLSKGIASCFSSGGCLLLLPRRIYSILLMMLGFVLKSIFPGAWFMIIIPAQIVKDDG